MLPGEEIGRKLSQSKKFEGTQAKEKDPVPNLPSPVPWVQPRKGPSVGSPRLLLKEGNLVVPNPNPMALCSPIRIPQVLGIKKWQTPKNR